MKNKEDGFINEGDSISNTNRETHYMATREEVIHFGQKYLGGIGASKICQVCIPNGGSCCIGCSYLKDKEGCQQRNTSCTSWLCGFLKFIFYEAGLFHEWYHFWDKIPGQGFRKDDTPSVVVINKWLEIPDVQLLSVSFAKDLSELLKESNQFGYVNRMNDELDVTLTELLYYNDPETMRKLKKLTKDFHHFHSENQ